MVMPREERQSNEIGYVERNRRDIATWKCHSACSSVAHTSHKRQLPLLSLLEP